jgi:nicotinic acid mononucleotide adenylyltransferase
MDFVAETLEKSPYEFEILGGYFCPSDENWIKKKLPKNYLPDAYRESLLLLATEGTRWMVDKSYSTPDRHSQNIIKAVREVYGESFEITVVHICGIDAIQNNGKRVPTQYPLVIVDRLGYDGEFLWKEYLQTTTKENRERLIWISRWTGEMRSSTMIRNLLTNLNDDNHIDTHQNLQNLLPISCIDYILEYKLQQWLTSRENL